MEKEYFDEFLLELDFDELDFFSQQQGPIPYQFSELVQKLMFESIDQKQGFSFLEDLLSWSIHELLLLKPMFLQILFISIISTVGCRLLEGRKIKTSQISFLMIYIMVTYLLMIPFREVIQLSSDLIAHMISFMTAFIPSYVSCLLLLGKPATGLFYSEGTMLMMYLVEWGIAKMILPLIQGYLFLIFLNHVFEEERLTKLGKYLVSLVHMILKVFMGVVLGIGAIQAMLSPAKDQLAGTGLLKGAKMIPGIGNSIDSVGEILLSCGMVVKNSMGVAAVLFLFFICLFPILKIGIVYLVYGLLSAILEPVADKRVVNMVHHLAQAIQLYLKTNLYAVSFFLLSITITTTST